MNKKQFVKSERSYTVELLKGLTDSQWKLDTLCKGWTIEDLAAHLIVRERYPHLDAGLIFPRYMNIHNKKIQKIKSRGHEYIIDHLKHYPWWMPASFNVAEFWIHNEDILRGGLNKSRPKPSKDAEELLWNALKGLVKVNKSMLDDLGNIIITNVDSAETLTVRNTNSDRETVLTGSAGELLLFCFGRRKSAKIKSNNRLL